MNVSIYNMNLKNRQQTYIQSFYYALDLTSKVLHIHAVHDCSAHYYRESKAIQVDDTARCTCRYHATQTICVAAGENPSHCLSFGNWVIVSMLILTYFWAFCFLFHPIILIRKKVIGKNVTQRRKTRSGENGVLK